MGWLIGALKIAGGVATCAYVFTTEAGWKSKLFVALWYGASWFIDGWMRSRIPYGMLMQLALLFFIAIYYQFQLKNA